MATTPFETLSEIRNHVGPRTTHGLDDATIEHFLERDPELSAAIEAAGAAFRAIRAEHPEWIALDETALRRMLQSDYVNFYSDDSINPYVPLGAKGPWVVTSHGAVLHDNGGYGMLGFGHAPQALLDAMAAPWVQANIMTPSFAQKRFSDRLRAEVGHTRGACPFDRFMCLNSGSEAVTLALRIADINCNVQTKAGARHEGREEKYLGLVGGFHGRTFLAARASHSTDAKYRQHLKSFRDRNDLTVVPANDLVALQAAFDQADREGTFIEAMLMEPVQGEGSPGTPIHRDFYDLARKLTREHDTLLLVDSIQAGLRAHGVLSIVDYPGFEDAEPPDLETYSKAINGGQYPFSVLALGPRASRLYAVGVYGNTMTTNPRALEVASAVLDRVTPELRANIRARGAQLLAGLKAMQAELPDLITGVKGTGLLCAAELDPGKLAVVGYDGIEERCRRLGLGVIHGGKNALRFTPHFRISADEIDLVLRLVRDVLVAARAELAERSPVPA